VEVGALKNVSALTRVKTLFDLPRAILKCAGFYAKFRPDVVISVGGYASGPGVLAAALKRVPLVIFEPNLVPGFANKIGARFAKAACVHFQETCRWFRNCTVTGVPVRKALFHLPPRPLGAPPTLLAFGGSQGARAINEALVAALPILREALPELKIIHQTGQKELESVRQGYAKSGVNAEVSAFIDDMPGAYAQADLIVCRSGSTVAEISAVGKPAIFVPFPRAADDHQTKNAQALVSADAGILMPQSELTAEKLGATIIDLFSHRERMDEMAANAHKLAHADAAAQIAGIAITQMKIKVN
jgi:UDP-N-acetylglucosamine--N-acetylmuramyl-(pentapeptide) pyrophosphoryl-undecaprenol N-acetylglucosamine transferase